MVIDKTIINMVVMMIATVIVAMMVVEMVMLIVIRKQQMIIHTGNGGDHDEDTHQAKCWTKHSPKTESTSRQDLFASPGNVESRLVSILAYCHCHQHESHH